LADTIQHSLQDPSKVTAANFTFLGSLFSTRS
jgi:hypothetical protein